MLYNGKKLEGPALSTLVLPRGEDVIVIRAQAVLSYKEFEKLVPQPQPPTKHMRGGAKQQDFDHPDYLRDLNHWGEQKTKWMILKSLQATPELQWEKALLGDPSTWHLFEDELEEAGFSEIERQRILSTVLDANSLNEKKLEEAREGFLSGRLLALHQNHSSSHPQEQKSTPSGAPANGSTSDHRELVPPGTN